MFDQIEHRLAPLLGSRQHHEQPGGNQASQPSPRTVNLFRLKAKAAGISTSTYWVYSIELAVETEALMDCGVIP